MQILPHLYDSNIQFETNTAYVMVNFSKSLLAHNYHAILMKCLDANISTYYEFKNQASAWITLEDFLPWSLCGLDIPIIYYVDNITTISNNMHWFSHRNKKGDLIADKNGNLLTTDSLII